MSEKGSATNTNFGRAGNLIGIWLLVAFPYGGYIPGHYILSNSWGSSGLIATFFLVIVATWLLLFAKRSSKLELVETLVVVSAYLLISDAGLLGIGCAVTIAAASLWRSVHKKIWVVGLIICLIGQLAALVWWWTTSGDRYIALLGLLILNISRFNFVRLRPVSMVTIRIFTVISAMIISLLLFEVGTRAAISMGIYHGNTVTQQKWYVQHMSEYVGSFLTRDKGEDMEKYPETILWIGDSFGFGAGIDDFSLTMGEVAGTTLQNLGLQVNVYSLVHPGWSTADEEEVLKQVLTSADPKMVVVGYVFNDIEDDQVHPVPSIWSHAHNWLNENFEVYYFFRIIVGGDFLNETDKAYQTPAWEKTVDRFLRMKAMLQEREIPLRVVVLPYFASTGIEVPTAKKIRKKVTADLRATGLQVFDTVESRAIPDTNGTYWITPTDGHPNEAAHRFIGTGVARWIYQSDSQIFIKNDNSTYKM
ncbi:MAG: SGNH/GDSL hydrolase family protein [Candidatus Lindowbacteria bacterium]|nr:SGNH/GDSL hydrolase family protein [Candidatus Lindowbacteria bacterium]